MLWIPYFPTKIFSMTKIGRFLRGFFTCRFFSCRFSWPYKDFQNSTPKSHVLVEFSLAKQCISLVWFPNPWFYLSRGKCNEAMFSCFKTKSEKNLPREVYSLARCLMLNWSRRHAFIYATKTWNLWDFLQFSKVFAKNFIKKIFYRKWT